MLLCLVTEDGKLIFGESSVENVRRLCTDLKEANQGGVGHTLIVEVRQRQVVCVDALAPLVYWQDDLSERLGCQN